MEGHEEGNAPTCHSIFSKRCYRRNRSIESQRSCVKGRKKLVGDRKGREQLDAKGVRRAPQIAEIDFLQDPNAKIVGNSVRADGGGTFRNPIPINRECRYEAKDERGSAISVMNEESRWAIVRTLVNECAKALGKELSHQRIKT